jgi:SAM-dependent methyltransferase
MSENAVLGMTALKKLDDSQVEDFDTDYVEGNRWTVLKAQIDRDFPGGKFSFLDVGGGNGRLADLLLATYPHSQGTVLDSSDALLARNKPHERKTIVCDSAENVSRVGRKHDLICMHWLLHHLVGANYAQTRRNQQAILRTLPLLMSENARVSIFENNYNGWVVDTAPGYLVYQLTSAARIAKLIRMMGANTAGVGVCFLSRRQWLDALERAGLRLLNYAEPDNWPWPLRAEWRALLHLKNIRVGHYWVSLPASRSKSPEKSDTRSSP